MTRFLSLFFLFPICIQLIFLGQTDWQEEEDNSEDNQLESILQRIIRFCRRREYIEKGW